MERFKKKKKCIGWEMLKERKVSGRKRCRSNKIGKEKLLLNGKL